MFIEDQATCGRWIRLPRERVVSLSQSSCESPAELPDGTGVGEESNHTTVRNLAIYESFKQSEKEHRRT